MTKEEIKMEAAINNQKPSGKYVDLKKLKE